MYFCCVKIHEKYINRCIELAKNGLGTTYPNPLVGSVVVHNGTVIGEGWHYQSGQPHAEVHAIQSVKNKSLLKEATIYVSLEPCCHFGKTPPCSDLIIQHQLKKVVIGTIDPFAAVAGKGIEKLKKAGIDVIVGVLENECQQLNKRFFTFHNQKRPYIILKWAQSADGYIAPKEKKIQQPIWISNTLAQQLSHKWRTEEAGIMVGTQTVLDDNPQLTPRNWHGNAPTRLIIDKDLKTFPNHAIYNAEAPTIILTSVPNQLPSENYTFEQVDFSTDIILQLTKIMYNHQIQSVIIEGGTHTINSFLSAGIWDEARVFFSEKYLKSGTLAPNFVKLPTETQQIDDNLLKIYYHHDS